MAIWAVLRFVLASILVIVLAAWATRALGQRARGAQSSVFVVLGGLALGAGRQLAAVQVGGRVLILGLGDKRVELLDRLTDPEEIALLQPASGTGGGQGGSFAAVVAAVLARKRGGERQAP